MDIHKETTIAIDDANKKDDITEAILGTEIKNDDKSNQVADNIAEDIKDDCKDSKIPSMYLRWACLPSSFHSKIQLYCGPNGPTASIFYGI